MGAAADQAKVDAKAAAGLNDEDAGPRVAAFAEMTSEAALRAVELATLADTHERHPALAAECEALSAAYAEAAALLLDRTRAAAAEPEPERPARLID